MKSALKVKQQSRGPVDMGRTVLPPVRGWNAKDPLAAMHDGDAIRMLNAWPTPTALQLRKGASNHMTGFSGNVLSLFAYRPQSGASKLFAATNAGIFDATAAGTVGANLSALTNGKCRHTSFTTTANTFLFVVNGVDNLTRFDGTAWTTPASYSINGGGTLNSNTIVNVNVFKRRLFFIVNNEMAYYHFDIDAVAGNVTRFPLGGLASRGGKLIAMGTWTIDGGEGVDDYAVFVTSEGQLIVYKGNDPTSATDWQLRGVYDLGKPLGYKCFLKFGGDLLYLCDTGLFPLSKALQSSTINAKAAVSDRISQAWIAATKAYKANFGWQTCFSLTDSLLLVNVPVADLTTSIQYVMNTQTGAWAQFDSWNAFCWELADDQLYMGMSTKVAKAWSGVSDFDGNINAYIKSAFGYLAERTRLKFIKQIRPLFTVENSASFDIQIDVDYEDSTMHGPFVLDIPGGSLWDIGLWDIATWAGEATPRPDWRTVAAKPGFCAAIRLRIVSKTATVEWSATDLLFELGSLR